jgi:hypothetical protein
MLKVNFHTGLYWVGKTKKDWIIPRSAHETC